MGSADEDGGGGGGGAGDGDGCGRHSCVTIYICTSVEMEEGDVCERNLDTHICLIVCGLENGDEDGGGGGGGKGDGDGCGRHNCVTIDS